MSAAVAPYVEKFLTVPGFDRRTFDYQKDDGTFRLITRKPLDGLDILTPKFEIKMFQLLIYCLL